MKENNMENFKNWSNPSEMVTLFEYYGKAQGQTIGRKVYETAIEDRVATEMKPTGNTKYPMVRAYPRTWLDKLDYIDQVHENGAVSDKEIIDKLVTEYENDGEIKEA
jgi:hypothetical protein|tara:strand:+ start:345 stop:665 length:321 start_codon:yes stop_codon:yes gene_type:complete